MTREEALGKARNDGVADDQITDAILRLYGYESPAPLGGFKASVVIAPEQVKQSLAALEAEAASNSLPAAIATNLQTVLAWAKKAAIFAVLFGVLLVSGCQSTAARQAVDEASVSVRALNEQHLAVQDKFVAYYRENETARINEWYDAAVKSATRSISVQAQKPVVSRVQNPDGSITERTTVQTVTEDRSVIESNIAAALARQRVTLLTGVEQRVSEIRAQQASICGNYANAMAYMEGLKSYFGQKATDYAALQKAQGSILSFLETFVGNVPKPAAAQ